MKYLIFFFILYSFCGCAISYDRPLKSYTGNDASVFALISIESVPTHDTCYSKKNKKIDYTRRSTKDTLFVFKFKMQKILLSNGYYKEYYHITKPQYWYFLSNDAALAGGNSVARWLSRKYYKKEPILVEINYMFNKQNCNIFILHRIFKKSRMRKYLVPIWEFPATGNWSGR